MNSADISVWIDGVLVGPDGARISVFDRGFLYGDSVFETLRTYGGRIFALDTHLERLAESARRVLIALPVTLETLAEELTAAVVRAGHTESYLRLMITRGTGALGLDPGSAERPLRVLLVGPLEAPSPSTYEAGIGVVSFVTVRHGDATSAAGAKIGNYLVAVLAAAEARKSGAQESLIVDQMGYVSEGSTSNVFWVEGGKLCTPPLEAGILAGITRAALLECASELSIAVEFRLPRLTELLLAQEVFVSSSIREMLGVVKIDGQAIGKGTPGPITRKLHAAFRERALARVR